MAHFSKYIRPGATRIGFENSDHTLMVTAAQNTDGSIAVIVLNQNAETKQMTLQLHTKKTTIAIQGEALQTILIHPTE